MEVTAFTHGGFQRYFRNTSWLLGGNLFRMCISILTTIAVARYLGPEDFGVLNFTLAVTLILGAFSSLGMNNRIRKELAENPGNHPEILGTYTALTLLSGFLTYSILMLVVCIWVPEASKILLYAWLGAVLLLSPLRCIEIWFQTEVRSKLPVMALAIGAALSAAAKLAFIIMDASLPFFGIAIFVETLATVTVLLFIYKIHAGPLGLWQINWRLSRQLLNDSWPLLLGGIAVTIYMQIDQVMLGMLNGDSAVGQYSAAVRFSTIWYFIPMMLATSLFPAIVRIRSVSKDLYQTRQRQYLQMNAFIAYLIILPVSAGAFTLVPLVFGEDYIKGAPVLSIHIWSLLFVFLGIARGQVLLVEGFYRFTMLSTVTGALVNVLLNYLLIPSYGGSGAAFATLVAQAVASVLFCFAYASVRPLGLALVKAAVFPFGFIPDLLNRK